jgi:hypothetical protein
MGKETSDFRYNTGDTKVPWAAVGENYNAQDLMELVKFFMGGKGREYSAALRKWMLRSGSSLKWRRRPENFRWVIKWPKWSAR